MEKHFDIREIQPNDNPELEGLIKDILAGMNVEKEGTAFGDESLGHMFETYQTEMSKYFVITCDTKVVAGAGIAPLMGKEEYAEIQKMYVKEAFRKKSLASTLMERCIETAKALNFEAIYLETLPSMIAAQKLYKKHGFDYLSAPLGETGHHNCTVRMLKKL